MRGSPTMRIQPNQRGFSLLELLVVTSIFTVVLFAVYMMYETNQTTFTRGKDKIDIQQNARVALEMMAMETRMAGYDPSPAATPATAIQTASANEILFIADVTGDNVSDKVRYQLVGGQVMREISSWVGGVWTPNPATVSPLADSATALSFTYYDANNAVTGTLANIRRITIGLTVQKTWAGKTERFPLTIDVRLRNL